MKFITLKQLTGHIKDAIELHTSEYWVVAEIASININSRSGHCYLDLIEKEDDRTLAQMRSTIWARQYLKIGAEFRAGTGTELKAGMKVLLRCQVGYHEVYGLSLNIREIDPNYTLGEMALKKKQTLERLAKEGLINRNRELSFPLVPQRIAVISSSQAAGYGDFMNRINENPFGYNFKIRLFEAAMQGTDTEKSIVAALKLCTKNMTSFDAVAIIRGGGAKADLQYFDAYGISSEVARCSLPVLSGIGHERDETVLDRVAHRRLITPTAVADYLIACLRSFDEMVESLGLRLIDQARDYLAEETQKLSTNIIQLGSGARRHLSTHTHKLTERAVMLGAGSKRHILTQSHMLDNASTRLDGSTLRLLKSHNNHLDANAVKVKFLDPTNVLKRGYSITTIDGKAIRDAKLLSPGDIISTRLAGGAVKSTVRETE